MTHTNGVGSTANLGAVTTVHHQRDAVKPQPVIAAPVKVDQASLSAAGLASQAGSDVRFDKVQALQTAIANKTYQVPASAVASKIVDSLLE